MTQNIYKPAWLKEGATVNAKYFGKVTIKALRPGHSGATEYATIINEHGTLLMQLCPVWQLTEIR